MRALLVTLLLSIVVVGAGAGPAVAHGGEVRLEVVEQEATADASAVDYLVALTYVNDGDGIDDATVTATPSPDGGPPGDPVTLTPTGTGGGYQGTVFFPGPGRWSVRFDSADPEARVVATHRVPEVATTEPPASTGAPPTSTAAEARLAADEGGSNGPPAVLVIGAVMAGLALVVTGIVLVLRRRSGA